MEILKSNLDDLEIDKEIRFRFLIEHPGSSLDDYLKIIYKDNLKKLKELSEEKDRK